MTNQFHLWGRISLLAPAALILAGCTDTGPAVAPMADTESQPSAGGLAPEKAAPASAAQRLSGRWEVQRLGGTDYPAKRGIVHFQSAEFFSHTAGCGGAHPAFYEAGEDGTLRTWRREDVIIGKCETADAPALERELAAFLDSAQAWSITSGGALVLTGTGGETALLKRPVGPVPALEGNWQVVSIDGGAWSGPEAAFISVGDTWFSATAGCNSGGAGWSSPGPGAIAMGDVAATQVLCGDALMKAESALFGAVAGITGYTALANGQVRLEGARPIVIKRAP